MSPTDLLFTPRRSRFVYGVGGDVVDWSTTLPVRDWRVGESTVGGRRIAAGRQGASFVVRTDGLVTLVLRFRATEWTDVLGLIRWGQGEESFTWYPDALDAATSHVVWLMRPEAGSDIEPTRDADYPRVLEQEITLRRRDLPETPWDLDYFGLDG